LREGRRCLSDSKKEWGSHSFLCPLMDAAGGIFFHQESDLASGLLPFSG
jgi:hypothetical protein